VSLSQFVPPPCKIPFSHTPGISGWLAGSNFFVQCFPTAFCLFECKGERKEKKVFMTFPELGKVSDWTVFFDTVHQKTTMQGTSTTFFRFELVVEQSSIYVRSLKGDVTAERDGVSFVLERGKKYSFFEGNFSSPRFKEPRLLLGDNKDPNLDRILLHPNMLEILPMWYQLCPPCKISIDDTSLLQSLAHSIEEGERSLIVEKFLNFFRAGMVGFFVPKHVDDLFLGCNAPPLPENFPLEHVHALCNFLIRSLFLEERGNTLCLLPCLPKEFISGRLLRERLVSGTQISIEWRKNTLRRVLIHPVQDQTFSLSLRFLKTYNVTSLGTREKSVTLSVDSPLELTSGKRYLLDNFS
jgi:hypothetical protein